MLPNQTALNQIAEDLVAVTGIFAKSDLEIALVREPFSPGLALVYGDLTLANFTGSSQKTWDPGLWAFDPATGLITFYPTTPAGGYQWETADTVNLPQTIYGYALLDQDSTTLYFSELLATPLELTAANQLISIPLPIVTMLSGAWL